jgi:hypothetical protein
MADTVRMEFTGTQAGATFWTVDNVVYRGGANATDKYADVDKDHVATLEKTGVWKKVEQPRARVAETAEAPKAAVKAIDEPAADSKASAKK